MSHARGILCLAALVVSAARCETPEIAYQDDRAGITFPVKIAEFRFAKQQSFDDPALGYSLSYRGSRGATMTVYVFDGGKPDIGDGKAGKHVTQFLREAQEDILTMKRLGHYDEVQELPMKPETDPRIRERFLIVRYRILCKDGVAEGEAARESYLACTGHHGFCIKTRCTSPITQDLTAEWSLFHKALAEILSTDRGKP